ncbi:HlyD family secretion protein [Gilliamella bombicola]|uniref:HlyD family secretion protein n=1 Tax=Gilliamella bombicola TaxID=1798182 RepID=A0A1C4ABV6_9GAMM|nr:MULTISPECIES: HlyD family secretion protein [Gilliamella]MWN05506.1 HlyD family efflux transporter periplasmic adaptor subunit [Gilliamella sp. Pas-s95]NUF27203.1 HlyD family efflux transporter periplasmic adaptor subunit [Gilliamella sp. ESL0254]SCB92104.1 HlyD family secretion protein [Gilliamella bombicola]
MHKKRLSLIIAIIAVIALVIIIYLANQPSTIILQGEVESNRVDVAARVQGRVIQFNYDVGDDVKQGDTLLTLSSPALLAQLTTAEAQLKVAMASRDNTYSTRPETIDVQKAQLDKAKSDLVLAQTSYERIDRLAKNGTVSKQSYDESFNQYQAAIKAHEAAKANLELAENGSSIEQKKLADAQVEQSEAALSQVKADVNELTLVSPISGQITTRVAETGQLYSPGTPLYSIIDLNDIWFTFNIREDLLGNLKVGDTFQVKVPALNNQIIDVKVTVLNALGQYANWQATKATGDFDLKTFEMRAKPINKVSGLRPGMSVTTKWQSH